MSLRTRLLLGMAVVGAVLATVSILTTVSTRNRLMDQIDRRLQTIGPLSGAGPDEAGPDDDRAEPADLPDDDASERISDVYEGEVGADGVLVTRFMPNDDDDYAVPALDVSDLPVEGSRFLTVDSENGQHTYRVLAEVVGDEVRITALPLDDVSSTVSRLIAVEAIGGTAVLIALGVVSWWVLHLGIRPVKEMTSMAERIADGDLDVRIPAGATGTESGDLAMALNRMLSTIGDALEVRTASEARLRRFVADASHELRTPVTTIRGYAELYRHGGLTDPGALDHAMRTSEQEAARMSRLIEDMLLLAKLDEERPLDVHDVDVGALVRDACTDAVAGAPGRDITCTIVPGGALVVRGDEDRLRQVLANLVGNALVHTDSDVPIRLHVQRDEGTVIVEVTDRGQGMAADVAERVTERFFRADTARARQRGGSGLGLSIVDAVVRAHGGTVTIRTTPGAGTTVRVMLPAATD